MTGVREIGFGPVRTSFLPFGFAFGRVDLAFGTLVRMVLAGWEKAPFHMGPWSGIGGSAGFLTTSVVFEVCLFGLGLVVVGGFGAKILASGARCLGVTLTSLWMTRGFLLL